MNVRLTTVNPDCHGFLIAARRDAGWRHPRMASIRQDFLHRLSHRVTAAAGVVQAVEAATRLLPFLPASLVARLVQILSSRHVLSVTVERPGGQPSRVCVSVEQINQSIDSCTGTRHNWSMIRSFRHRGLSRLYERDDPSRISADQLHRITLALADLDAAGKPSDLDLPGYRLHPLRGDRRGLWSISITGNWRITFRFEAGDVYDVDLVDYH